MQAGLGPRGAAIVDSAEEATRLLDRGQNVVLLVDPDAAQVVWPAGGRGAGRLAVLVGRPDDPVARAAAAAMAAELFGSG